MAYAMTNHTASIVYGRPTDFEPLEREEMLLATKGLLDILSWSRPHDSDAEQEFIKTQLMPALRLLTTDITVDGFGNIWAEIRNLDDTESSHMWSCHIDTMAAKGGRQAIGWQEDGRTLELVRRKPGRALGADDGAGMWLLLQMMAAEQPGCYVFHRGEEQGRLGSRWISENLSDYLGQRFVSCVAFDRRDYADIITHQIGARTCSDDFAWSLAGILGDQGQGLRYRPDDTGSYTDSYSYAAIIPECSNVSVGYDREHGPNETLDALHLFRLRNALCTADFTDLEIVRDPTTFDAWGYGDYGAWQDNDWRSEYYQQRESRNAPMSRNDRHELAQMVELFPEAVASFLIASGIGPDDLAQELTITESEQWAAMRGQIG